MHTVTVNASTRYDVLIGAGLLDRAGELAAERMKPCRAAIIADSTVDALYGARAEAAFRRAGFEIERLSFPAGEASKNLRTLEVLLEGLAERHITRSDLVIALGGGVTGDIAGFAAAVYARGIRFIQMPTTLLAAVDSSVGGKTAVDLRAGKNLAGSFHQPSLVITDTDVLRCLPEDQLSCGAAEVIKYGVLSDVRLFEMMECGGWLGEIDEIVARSVANKRDVVAQDEFDTGARQFLNLGHTFGHAIEKCSGLAVSHGQAVAMGMVMAASAAECPPETILRIARCVRANGLSTHCGYGAASLTAAALSDKKRAGGQMTLVLPRAVGKCELRRIDVSDLGEYFERALAAQEAYGL